MLQTSEAALICPGQTDLLSNWLKMKSKL